MLDGDTLSDYGTIEFSVDYGATWRNVVKPDPYYGYPWWVLYDSTGNVLKSSYNSSDTIVFTGTTNGWYQFTIMDWLEMTVYDSIIFRFTYYTSATATPHNGWMIDDIWFNTMWESVPERGQSFIAYPNPAADRLTITPGMRATAWKITDMTGSVVLQGVSHESLVNIDVSGLKKGFYIYKLRLENGSEKAGKFLKE